MATVFSHAVSGLAITTLIPAPGSLRRCALVGALCAAVPDLDVIATWFGVPWGHVLGHRGITHSAAFAAALAAVLAVTVFRGPAWNGRRGGLWLVLFLATASHGVLDAMTTGGPGVAFWAPFDAGTSCRGGRSRSRRSAHVGSSPSVAWTSCRPRSC